MAAIFSIVLLCAGSGIPGGGREAAAAGAADGRAENSAVQPAKSVSETLLETFDFTEIDGLLTELFPEERLTFAEMVRKAASGEEAFSAELVNRMVKDQLFYALRVNRKSLLKLVAIAVSAALFLNLSGVFRSGQVSRISFFMLYMLLMGIGISSFRAAAAWVEDGVAGMNAFMKVLYPVYFLAVTAAKGSVSALAFYHLALLLVLLIEWLVLKILLPMIHVYVMVRMLNSLQSGDYLSKLAELLELVIGWSLKGLPACMIGLNVIQGLVAPAIDSLKRSAVTRGAEAIPGIGDLLGGTAEVALAAAVVIKNSIGLAGAVICCVLCLTPLLQLAALTLGYKLAAALVQPVTDPRIVECISGVGEGMHFLLRTVAVCGVLFLLSIAIVAYTTGGA